MNNKRLPITNHYIRIERKMSKLIAYFDSSHDMPEEIVMAAGMTPYKILGDVHQTNDPANQYIQEFMCPAARSILTESLERSKDWDGIVIAHGCDATNRFYDVYKLHVDIDFLYWVNKPMNNNKTAAKFFKKELEHMIKTFEKKFNVKITDQKLKEAIATSNTIKKKLQELSAMRAEKDIPNKEYFDICVKAVQLPRDELIALLDDTIKNWMDKPDFPDDKMKIMLTGSDITYSEWMELLDEADLRVVRDDLSVGERYYALLIPEGLDDPLDAIVKYHLNIPRPSTKNPADPRLDYLMKAMEESNLNLVVSQNLKFCEPYAFDSVFTTNALKEEGYNVIHLEREFSPTKDMSTRTRLEAFAEIGLM